MADVGRNRFSSVLMVAAFVVMGGFLYWLSQVTEPTQIAVAEEEEEAVEALTIAEFAQNPAGHSNEAVELPGVEVDELMGSHAFFFELADGEPYLVRLHPNLIQDGVQVLPGDRGRIAGTVQMMTDSVLEVWDAEQIFTEDQRARAATVESFIYADEVEITGQAAGDDETEDPDGD